MQQKLKNTLLITMFLIAPSFLRSAATAPVILGINYSCADSVIHIGSTMTVYMSAMVPITTYNALVTATTATDLTLDDPNLIGLGSTSTQLFVTDGIRTWMPPFAGGVSQVQINDGSLLNSGLPGMAVGSSYGSLANANFRVYFGNLLTGSSANLNVDLGTFANLELYDNATHGDTTIDGVWTGLYLVPDLNFMVVNAKLFGYVDAAGVLGSNSPFQSAVSFALDGKRPEILFYSMKTNNPFYVGMLYLSSQSQGTTTPQPTNNQARFDVNVNKQGTIVDIIIGNYPANTFVKKLPPIYFPANAVNLNGFKFWNGDDQAGTFVSDGRYMAAMYVRDENGVTGLTKTALVTVISLRMYITDTHLTPSMVNISQLNTADPSDDVSVNYRVVLDNESGTSIISSLNILGWNGTYFGTNPACITCTVTAILNTQLLFPDGTKAIDFKGHDGWLGDNDKDLLTGGTNLYGPGFRFDPRVTLADCYSPLPSGAFGTTGNTAVTVDVGDGNTDNDWADLIPGFIPDNPNNPTKMTLDGASAWAFTSATPGSLRVKVGAQLTGFQMYLAGPADTLATMPDQCNQVGPPFALIWKTQREHFAPNESWGSQLRAEDTSVILTIADNPPPVSDTTPPLLISNSPQDASLFGPGVYGPSSPLTAQVQDGETQINNDSNTNIKVVNPSGAFVGGTSKTNGGGLNNTATISFTPYGPLNQGGDYTMTISACNQAGLCISRNIKFTIQDQTAPSVAGAEIVTNSTSSNQPLTIMQTSPDGPFSNVTQIWATLSMPSTSSNTIDWDSSTISLRRVDVSPPITIPTSRITLPGTVPLDGKLKYKLNNTLTSAGQFEVVVQTFSKDGSGGAFTGPPAGFINPEFSTIVNPNTLSLKYPNGVVEAVSGSQPVGVTVGSQVFQGLSTNTQALLPNFSLLNANTGFLPITSSASTAYGLQFNYSLVGGGASTTPGIWTYSTSTPLRFYLYFDNVDLPASVTSNNNLKLCGYDGSSWTTLVQNVDYNAVLNNVTNNVYTVLVPNGSPAYSVYGIFYASTGPAIGSPTVAPTAVPFKSTRSFNPTSSNAVVRKAKFYYSDVVAGVFPKEVEVKVYDTSGTLIRTSTLGAGVNVTDIDTDPNYSRSAYFFVWDGANDTGNLVKNGIYLVRYRVTKTNGNTDTQTKLVALIK